MEIVSSIAVKIAECIVAPVGQWLCYSFHYKSNIENLEKEENNLRDVKNRVQHSVEAALINNYNEEIEDEVNTWLKKVGDIIELATNLRESEEEAGTRSSNVACLNLKHRHQISREAKKIKENIVELVKNGNFDRVSYLPTLEGMDYNIENLKNQEENLRDFKNKLQHSVEAALRNGDEIEDGVNKWLTKANRIIELATMKLREIEEEASTRSSNATCLNLKHRCQLSREAKKMVGDIAELVKNGNFDRVSYRLASQEIVTPRNMDCMEFVSRMPTVKGLKEALGDANINLIVLWGMPGVGKTTLMREVARQVKEDKLFDEVAWADVTQSQDWIRRIQGEIADMLDLKLDAESTLGRANRLRKRLTTKEKRILVILDDIWEKIELKEIGIPYKECKVVLVSRQRDLPYPEMGTQKDFGIEVLPEKEAWEMFEKMAADSVKDPNLQSIATEVAKECDGLPIALVTVAKALNNKDLCEWKDALQKLRFPALEYLTRMQSPIYSCIELSFRHLESQEIKDLFLYCAGMEFDIHRLDLVKYCYGLGLFHGINTLEDARNRLNTLLRSLKDSCLLQDFPHDSRFCRMHDVVRDVAMFIASRDYGMRFMGDDGGLKEWPDALERCKAFSIRGGDIPELPNELKCPELRFLLVNGRDCSLQIPDTFFQQMEKLKVLNLTAMKLSLLPSSLLLLKNLQTLSLDQCELGDISAIGELKKLVVLSLLHSDISTLPREIGWLSRLRLLDLTDCSKLEVIPPNVLSRLVELEELYMGNSFVQWEAEGLITERSNNANLAELKCMLLLTTLEIHIRDACMLPKDLCGRFEKLKRYHILVGDVWDWSDKHECSKTLKLKLKTSFQSEVVIKMLLKTIECLYLHELKGVKSVLHELDREGFQQLKHLHIQNNDEIKYIIIGSPVHISAVSFPALETFLLKNMTGLEDICHGQLQSRSFRNLRVVKVENCEKLKFVFPLSVARGLSQLQELQIRECGIMGAIVMKEEGEIEDTDMNFFPQLRHLALEHLPKLMSFLRTKNSFATDAGEIVSEDTLDFYMPILHEQIVFPNLERLELSSVQLQETHHNQHRARFSFRLTTMEAMSRFRNLSNLELQGSCNIKYLLSFSTARFMVHLKHLHISDCKAMEEVLVPEEIAEAREIMEVFPGLECLRLKDLPNLKRFCIGCNIQFPSLEMLLIDHCPKLLTFIFNPSSSSATTIQDIVQMNVVERPLTVMQPLFTVEVAFPCLKAVGILRMDYLKYIWQNQFAENSFCNLEFIRVELCENLVSIFQSNMLTRFQSVEELVIGGCSSLQEVFELQELNVNENQAVITMHLKELKLDCLPQMKHVWSKDPKGVFSFKNLKQIWACECENLVSFFPASIAKSIMQLETLEIIDCGVEEIVEDEGGEDTIERFVFPQVTLLTFKRLPRLKWFYPRVHTLECPMLKKIWVEGCQKVDIFAYGLPSFQTLRESRHEISTQQPLFLVHEVAFPSLETLAISHMDNLITIWHDQVAAKSFCNIQYLQVTFCENVLHVFDSDICSFQNLRQIYAKGCESLKSFFPTISVATSLTQLEILKICNCGIEEIVARGRDQEATPRFVFPRMTILHLEGLAKLKWFYPGVYTSKWPLLEVIWVGGCQKIEIFASEYMSFQEVLEESRQSKISSDQPFFLVDQDQKAFPSLKILAISHMDNLITIWHDQVAADSFCNIRLLEVTFCESLKSFLPTVSVATSLTQLEILKICNCGIEEIVARGRDQEATPRFVFPRMTILHLEGLAKLKWFYPGVHTSKWPLLEVIWVGGCQKIEIFASEYMSFQEVLEESRQSKISSDQPLFLVDQDQVAFPSLEILRINHMDDMKVIWNTQFAADSFCKLQNMSVESCANLNSIFPFQTFKVFQSLELLNVVRCSSLKQVFDLQGPSFQETNVITVTQLKHLYLDHLPKLKHISNKDPCDILSFQNLRHVRAIGCESMEYLFPASMARTLTELESLVVMGCGVEVIVDKEEAEGRLVFPKLTFLALEALRKLKWISPGAHNLELPVLKELRAWGCDQVSIFASKFSRFQETSQQCLLESSIQHPLFLVEEDTFPKLEVLRSDPHDMITWHDQLFIESFCNLKVLEVQCNHDTSAIFPSNLLKSLQNLEKLVVNNNSWQEIFQYEEFIGPGNHARLLPQLKELRVCKARMLTHLWKEDIQESLVFHKVLEILAVSECHKLKSLVPSSVCFHNLTDLEILSCNGLINLITHATAKSLVQLRKMSVSSCEGIIEIVAKGDDQAKVVITFSKLTCLKFDCLPNFASFCSGSYSIMFPYLEEVFVGECPVMKTFSHGVLSTPKLKGVQATTRGEKSHTNWKNNLNNTIHSLWKNKQI
ncbi:hypothetical protein I3842_08G171500 [Carya illinoinensis]|uniref:AAA+ ATPase domain-containing protein n=1 Tax=Carya illinoinensis TaxID=32201 RepID=A0A922EGG9_CARIL|nr:hypothetical protein I3842_08G171500 [Carya illinoinensis]